MREQGIAWPEWAERRLGERGITEVELRTMLQSALGYEPDLVEDRWVVWCRFRRRRWKVILEPEQDRRAVVVVTFYPVV